MRRQCRELNFRKSGDYYEENCPTVVALLAALAVAGFAQEGAVPKGVPHLDHVFLIMMENHGYTEILGNPNAKFITQ